MSMYFEAGTHFGIRSHAIVLFFLSFDRFQKLLLGGRIRASEGLVL